MPRLMPFRAVHYDPRRVGVDLGALISPPYDVVDGEAAGGLAERHPYNSVRLELHIPSAESPADRYCRAAALWEAWRREGILVQDEVPSLYVCEHAFFHEGRHLVRAALVGCLAPGVMAHEETMAVPKQDRLELLRACHAQFSPILVLYEDPHGRVASALRSGVAGRPPELEVHTGEEVLRVWRLKEDAVARVTGVVAPLPAVIADGHHRYESARRFAEETGEERHERVLAALVSTADPGLLVLPTHRLVRRAGPGGAEGLVDAVAAAFGCAEVVARAPRAGAAAWWARLESLVSSRSGLVSLAAVTAGGARVLSYQGETAEALRVLDGVVHGGQGATQRATQGPTADGEAGAARAVEYTRDAAYALDEVLAGQAEVTFLVPAVSVGEVFRKAREGYRFPRKTTYFHPKVPAGLLVCDLDG
ncbi:MAG: DUF1015 domain-containing protein [Bacillota bacterium]|nr:DUF1015 domain-containing protein [Bacillota bacterium]